MFVLVNLCPISIHDGDYRVPSSLESIINGAAHHTDHHFLYNYGLYFIELEVHFEYHVPMKGNFLMI